MERLDNAVNGGPFHREARNIHCDRCKAAGGSCCFCTKAQKYFGATARTLCAALLIAAIFFSLIVPIDTVPVNVGKGKPGSANTACGETPGELYYNQIQIYQLLFGSSRYTTQTCPDKNTHPFSAAFDGDLSTFWQSANILTLTEMEYIGDNPNGILQVDLLQVSARCRRLRNVWQSDVYLCPVLTHACVCTNA